MKILKTLESIAFGATLASAIIWSCEKKFGDRDEGWTLPRYATGTFMASYAGLALYNIHNKKKSK